MSRASQSASFFFYITLVAVASLVCLIFAIYVIESRQSVPGTLPTHWKQLDKFVKYASTTPNTIHFIPPIDSVAPTIPSIPPHRRTISNYSGNIFMDWIADSDDFDYINYKSLESILSIYPHAAITVNLIAPNAAHYYKMGNLISKHYFQKYQKHGYDVKIKIVYRKFRERFPNDVLPPGATYWNEEFTKRCEGNKALEINLYRDIPAHMYFFLRFFTLWAHGGLYFDFSWFHTTELPEATNLVDGSIIKLFCPKSDSVVPLQTSNLNAVRDEKRRHCKASTLLSFSKNSSIPYCMLLQYNDTSSLLRQCIQRDVLAEGVNCVASALSECYRLAEKRNNFMKELKNIQFTMACSDNANENGINSEIVNGEFMCSMSPETYHAQLFEINHGNSKYYSNSAVVWLGPSAFDGQWTLPKAGSLLNSLINQTILLNRGPNYKNNAILTEPSETQQNMVSFSPYPLSVLGYVSRTESDYLQQLLLGSITYRRAREGCPHYNYTVSVPKKLSNQAMVSCALHFVVPGFMKAGTTYLFGTLITHPMLLHTLRGVTFKETGCYGPQFTRPKVPSSNPKERLPRPSNVTADNFVTFNRMHCFPFVEPWEEMYFGDGTVWYNSHKEVPDSLLADNPSIKVIFSVRNPIHRTQSQHRFNYKTLIRKGLGGDLNEIVYYLLDPLNDAGNGEGSLVSLREQAVEILREKDPAVKARLTEALVWNFRYKSTSKSKKYSGLNQLIKYSIYFPPIYVWFQKIPTGNVLVVPVELLQADKITEQTKLEYVRNLSTPEEFKRVNREHLLAQLSGKEATEDNNNKFNLRLESISKIQDSEKRDVRRSIILKQFKSSEEAVARQQIAPLNSAYTVAQYNRIFRFLGLPAVTEVAHADSHHTGDKSVSEEHKLNATSKALLREYFKPFNILLEQFLGGLIGYNDE